MEGRTSCTHIYAHTHTHILPTVFILTDMPVADLEDRLVITDS